MIEFILMEANRPFAVAIGFMLGLGLLETIMAFGGLGMTGLLDSLVPDSWDIGVDVDAPDIDADLDIDADVDADMDADIDGAGAASFLHAALGVFGIGKAPLLVVIVAFLTSFGLAGFVTQGLVHGVTGYYLPALFASVPAAIGGTFVTRYVAIFVGWLLPDVETSAVDSGTFIGRTAVLTLGKARAGQPAEAKLKDQNDQVHYLMIEPDEPGVEFQQGDEVLLVSRQGSVFKAIAVTSDALTAK